MKQPNEDMVKILVTNKCKCMFKVDDGYQYLWIMYGDAVKRGTSSHFGLDTWGESDQILEKVKAVVFQYYPRAEITSQSGNKNVTFHLNA